MRGLRCSVPSLGPSLQAPQASSPEALGTLLISLLTFPSLSQSCDAWASNFLPHGDASIPQDLSIRNWSSEMIEDRKHGRLGPRPVRHTSPRPLH